ncbi:MAG: HDOD domain-containing protein [Pseudomonadota bacterium]
MEKSKLTKLFPAPSALGETMIGLTNDKPDGKEGKPVAVKSDVLGLAALFGSRKETFKVLCLCDLDFVQSTGVAMCPASAEEQAPSGKLSDETFENICEFFNILATLFHEPVRVEKVFRQGQALPEAIVGLLVAPVAQQDLQITFSGKKSGNISLVVLDKIAHEQEADEPAISDTKETPSSEETEAEQQPTERTEEPTPAAEEEVKLATEETEAETKPDAAAPRKKASPLTQKRPKGQYTQWGNMGRSGQPLSTSGFNEEVGSAHHEDSYHFHVADKLRTILLEKIDDNTLALPALPKTALKAQELLSRQDTDLKKVAEMLRQDPVLSLQILRLANSALYGGHERFDDIGRAVLHLGAWNVRSVLYAATAHRIFSSENTNISKTLKKLWDHCVAVAQIARRFCEGLEIVEDEPFLAGLLHDIGKPIVGTYLRVAEQKLKIRGEPQWLSEEQWTEIVDTLHRPVSFAIVDRWKVPEQVAAGVRDCEEYDPQNPTKIANVICFANNLAKKLGFCAGSFDVVKANIMVSEGLDLFELDEAAEEHLSEGISDQIDPAIQ